MARKVSVRDVGLRDGIQALSAPVDTAIKLEWLRRLAEAGIVDGEIASMVPDEGPIVQFRDAETIVRQAKTLPGFKGAVLVPNRRGAERALALGADKIVYVLSVSEAFSEANVRRSREAAFLAFLEVADLVRAQPEALRPEMSVGFSCVFGSGLEPVTETAEVVRWAARVAEVGVDEIALADTVGFATPNQVRDMMGAVAEETGTIALAAHFHDTRGMAMANALAALDVGIDRFDSSLGGLGGCPNAPGTTGNINTEDLVFMLEGMGCETGIDLTRLLDARAYLAEALPEVPLAGRLASAGLPRHARTH